MVTIYIFHTLCHYISFLNLFLTRSRCINAYVFSLFFCSRRICFCSLGFPRNLHSPDSKHDFLQELIRVEAFLKDPLGVTVSRERTVQVRVPKVTPVPAGDGGDGVDAVEDSASVLAAQSKRLVLQRKAAAEVYARKVELGDIAVIIIYLHLTLCACLGICLCASVRCTLSLASEILISFEFDLVECKFCCHLGVKVFNFSLFCCRVCAEFCFLRSILLVL